jgi:muconolactone delta-isomerase
LAAQNLKISSSLLTAAGERCSCRTKPEYATMLFLVVSTPRPERPSDMVRARQLFWPWIAGYQARGACRHIYARAGRGAVAVFDVADNDALHRVLNEWADIIPAHFDTYPLIDADAANRMLAAQTAAPSG